MQYTPESEATRAGRGNEKTEEGEEETDESLHAHADQVRFFIIVGSDNAETGKARSTVSLYY